MDDVFDARWRERFGERHAGVEAELASLIDVHGASLLDQSAQLRLLLTQACPDAQRQIAMLLAAVSAGVARRLRGASDDTTLPATLKLCVETMRRHGVEDPDWAWWAVRTWAHAFALPTGGDARPTPPSSAPPRAPFAPWQTETPAAAPVPAPAPVPASAPVRAPTGAPVAATNTTPPAPTAAPASTPTAQSPAPNTAPVAAPIANPRAPAARPTAPRRASPVSVEPGATQPVQATLPFADTVPGAITPETAWDGRREPAMQDTVPLDEPTFVATVATPPGDTGQFPPTAFMPGRSWNNAEERPRRTRRPALIATAIAVPVMALLIYGAWSWNSNSSPPATTVARADVVPPPPVVASVAPTAGPSAASTPESTTTPPPTAADAPSPTSAVSPTSAESTTSPAEATSPQAPAPPASAVSPSAMTSTSNAASGSAVERAVPAPAASAPTTPAASTTTMAPTAPTTPRSVVRKPVIAKIDVPRVVAGEAFTLVVRLGADARDVTGVERRIGAAHGAWPASGVVPVQKKGSDTIAVPFKALAAASRATIEFTAIGADGARSEPKSVTIAVAEAPPPPAVVGAVGCTPTTCGTVVETHEIANDTGVYRIVVRTEARESLSFTAPYRLQNGTRVRVVAGRVVPTGS